MNLLAGVREEANEGVNHIRIVLPFLKSFMDYLSCGSL
jgi:hypothetical protein